MDFPPLCASCSWWLSLCAVDSDYGLGTGVTTKVTKGHKGNGLPTFVRFVFLVVKPLCSGLRLWFGYGSGTQLLRHALEQRLAQRLNEFTRSRRADNER